MAPDDLAAIARRHGIRLLIQFGSSVTGRTHPGSDVDLAIQLDRPGLSLREHGEIAHALQALFPQGEVDLVEISRADPLLLKHIVEGGRLLHGPVGLLQQLRLYAFKRYQDHRRFLEMERAFVQRALEPAAR